MTTIKFCEKEGILTAFEISGHTQSAEHGKDVLCSAISTASQMIVWGIVNELKIKTDVEKRDGFLKINLEKQQADNPQVQILMRTGLNTLRNIVRNQKKYVKLEVKNEI